MKLTRRQFLEAALAIGCGAMWVDGILLRHEGQHGNQEPHLPEIALVKRHRRDAAGR